MMPLLRSAARHASCTDEVPALPVPRPETFAALRTARNVSGCVLVLDPPQVRRRPASVTQTPLARPHHHQRHRPGHIGGNGGAEDTASGDDLVVEMSDMYCSAGSKACFPSTYHRTVSPETGRRRTSL